MWHTARAVVVTIQLGLTAMYATFTRVRHQVFMPLCEFQCTHRLEMHVCDCVCVCAIKTIYVIVFALQT